MLRRVALVGTDVSEEPSASFIKGTRIGELGTTLAVTSNRRTSYILVTYSSKQTNHTLWLSARKRTIPTERPQLVDEFSCQLLHVACVGCLLELALFLVH
jgi:hypothetical protein